MGEELADASHAGNAPAVAWLLAELSETMLHLVAAGMLAPLAPSDVPPPALRRDLRRVGLTHGAGGLAAWAADRLGPRKRVPALAQAMHELYGRMQGWTAWPQDLSAQRAAPDDLSRRLASAGEVLDALARILAEWPDVQGESETLELGASTPLPPLLRSVDGRLQLLVTVTTPGQGLYRETATGRLSELPLPEEFARRIFAAGAKPDPAPPWLSADSLPALEGWQGDSALVVGPDGSGKSALLDRAAADAAGPLLFLRLEPWDRPESPLALLWKLHERCAPADRPTAQVVRDLALRSRRPSALLTGYARLWSRPLLVVDGVEPSHPGLPRLLDLLSPDLLGVCRLVVASGSPVPRPVEELGLPRHPVRASLSTGPAGAHDGEEAVEVALARCTESPGPDLFARQDLPLLVLLAAAGRPIPWPALQDPRLGVRRLAPGRLRSLLRASHEGLDLVHESLRRVLHRLHPRACAESSARLAHWARLRLSEADGPADDFAVLGCFRWAVHAADPVLLRHVLSERTVSAAVQAWLEVQGDGSPALAVLEDWRRALERAAEGWEEGEWALPLARVLTSRGAMMARLGAPTEGLEDLVLAADLLAALGSTVEVEVELARTVTLRAQVHADLRLYPRALEDCSFAAEAWTRLAHGGEASLDPLAEISRLRGFAFLESGQPHQALAHLQRSLELYQDLHARGAGDDPLSLPRVHVLCGRAAWLMGDPGPAQAACTSALRLVTAQGNEGEAAELAAQAYRCRALAREGLGELPEAAGDLGAACELRQRLIAEGRLDLRADLAEDLVLLGPILAALGETRPALAHLRQAVELLKDLVERMDRAELRPRLAQVAMEAGLLASDLDEDSAEQHFDCALRLFQDLVEREGRGDLRAEWAAACNNRGLRRVRAGRLEEALGDFDESLHQYELLGMAAGSGQLAHEQGLAHFNRAGALRRLGDFAAAIAGYDRSVQSYLKAAEHRESVELERDLAAGLVNRGVTLLASGDPERAEPDLSDGVSLLEHVLRREPEANRELGVALFQRALARSRLGRRAEALEDLERCTRLEDPPAGAHACRLGLLPAATRESELRERLAGAEGVERVLLLALSGGDAGAEWRALRGMPGILAPEVAGALADSGKRHLEVGDVAQARVDLDEARRLLQDPACRFDRTARLSVEATLARTLWEAGEAAAAAGLASAILAGEDASRLGQRARADLLLAIGKADLALRLYHELLESAPEPEGFRSLARAHRLRAVEALVRGDLQQAQVDASWAVDLLEERGLPDWERVGSHLVRFLVGWELGDDATADVHLAAAAVPTTTGLPEPRRLVGRILQFLPVMLDPAQESPWQALSRLAAGRSALGASWAELATSAGSGQDFRRLARLGALDPPLPFFEAWLARARDLVRWGAPEGPAAWDSLLAVATRHCPELAAEMLLEGGDFESALQLLEALPTSALHERARQMRDAERERLRALAEAEQERLRALEEAERERLRALKGLAAQVDLGLEQLESGDLEAAYRPLLQAARELEPDLPGDAFGLAERVVEGLVAVAEGFLVEDDAPRARFAARLADGLAARFAREAGPALSAAWADALITLGRVEELLGRPGEAYAALQRAHPLYRAAAEVEGWEDLRHAAGQAACLAGALLDDLGQREGAEEWYSAALGDLREAGETGPTLVRTMLSRGRVRLDLGRAEEAREDYERALDLYLGIPSSEVRAEELVVGWSGLCEALEALGLLDEAECCCEHALATLQSTTADLEGLYQRRERLVSRFQA